MPARPVQISIDEALLARIDADPEAQEQGRSAFVRAAVALYLRVKERRSVDDALRRAYADQADSQLDEARALMEAQAWPDP